RTLTDAPPAPPRRTVPPCRQNGSSPPRRSPRPARRSSESEPRRTPCKQTPHQPPPAAEPSLYLALPSSAPFQTPVSNRRFNQLYPSSASSQAGLSKIGPD